MGDAYRSSAAARFIEALEEPILKASKLQPGTMWRVDGAFLVQTDNDYCVQHRVRLVDDQTGHEVILAVTSGDVMPWEEVDPEFLPGDEFDDDYTLWALCLGMDTEAFKKLMTEMS